MDKMRLATPSTGPAFLIAPNSTAAIACWPPTAPPSPMLGVALDGFPIHGPYDATGSLITALSGRLDECNFDALTNKYHFTPDAPYGPICLVGVPLPSSSSYTDVITTALCPVGGIDNIYCEGAHCEPAVQEECVPVPFIFKPSIYFWSGLCGLILDVLYVVYEMWTWTGCIALWNSLHIRPPRLHNPLNPPIPPRGFLL